MKFLAIKKNMSLKDSRERGNERVSGEERT